MINDSFSVLYPLILSWNLRNTIENPSMLFPEDLCIIGSGLGKYPIDAWKPYFLEVPKCGHKKDISGRGSYVFSVGMKNTEWNAKRTIILPLYIRSQFSDIGKLKTLIKHWRDIFIPDDIPSLAIAVKYQGSYSDCREAQSVAVLAIWHDGVSRVISLDWAEGPLEDCITPEWYVETTPLLNLRTAIEKMQKLYKNIQWDNPSFSIYTIPSCLGYGLHGKMVDTSYTFWNHEWKYTELAELKDDLNLLFSTIQDIFFNDSNGI